MFVLKINDKFIFLLECFPQWHQTAERDINSIKLYVVNVKTIKQFY